MLTTDDIEADTDRVTKQVDRLSVGSGWTLLPPDIQDLILGYLPLLDLCKAFTVCKSFWKVTERRTFRQARGNIYISEFSLSPLVFYVEKEQWHLTGFDYQRQVWRKLPPFKHPIPAPDPELFKDFHVAGDLGLFCVNIGKATEAEKLYISNPLTGETRKLPRLKYSRHPVLIYVHVALAKKYTIVTSTYWIIAIGSAAIGTESLSRKTEIFDSVKGEWEPAEDVPGTDFSLNDYQTGVYCERQGLLLCVGFMVNGSKGILAFDVKMRKWRDWICPFYQPHPVTETALSVYFAISQLVVCSNVVYLFSEQEAGRNVTHCIDRLDLDSGGGYRWTRKVARQRQGNRALLVYPEFTCVPLKNNKLCIFNTIERTGVVYDMLNDHIDPENYESLPAPPPIVNGVMFHSLNPVGYAFQPSFAVSVPELPEAPEEDEGVPSMNAVILEESNPVGCCSLGVSLPEDGGDASMIASNIQVPPTSNTSA